MPTMAYHEIARNPYVHSLLSCGSPVRVGSGVREKIKPFGGIAGRLFCFYHLIESRIKEL
jgi:hypothetical protein